MNSANLAKRIVEDARRAVDSGVRKLEQEISKFNREISKREKAIRKLQSLKIGNRKVLQKPAKGKSNTKKRYPAKRWTPERRERFMATVAAKRRKQPAKAA